MKVRTKDKLTEPECNEGSTADCVWSLGESHNPMWQLHIATHPFLQFGLHDLFLRREFYSIWVNIAKNGQQLLIYHVFQGHDDLDTGKEKGMGSNASRVN